MPQELDEWHARAGGYVPRPSFDVYAEKYSRYFAMRRRDGIIELRMHTDGGPARFDFAVHNAWPQVWQEVGNDPDNEVLIITGTGEQWLATPEAIAADPSQALDGLRQEPPPKDFTYEHAYYDATKLLENFVFGIDIPTIAAINSVTSPWPPRPPPSSIRTCWRAQRPATGSSSPCRSSSAPSVPPTISTLASLSGPSRPWSWAWSMRCCLPSVCCFAPGRSPRPS
jgi:hypothetical protein